jgi:hypothetical protein
MTENTTVTAIKKPKMVKIKLEKTRKEQADVYVAVNGKSWLIKRGEYVEVPASVAEVLTHKEEMLDVAMAYEAQASANANH